VADGTATSRYGECYLYDGCAVADGLVKKLEEMEKTAGNYRNLMEHTRRLLRAFFNLSQAHRGGHCVSD